jgi:hypothetical protein
MDVIRFTVELFLLPSAEWNPAIQNQAKLGHYLSKKINLLHWLNRYLSMADKTGFIIATLIVVEIGAVTRVGLDAGGNPLHGLSQLG